MLTSRHKIEITTLLQNRLSRLAFKLRDATRRDVTRPGAPSLESGLLIAICQPHSARAEC